MQMVLKGNETQEIMAEGVKKVYGFSSNILDIDVVKQRNGEIITTVTMGNINAKQVKEEVMSHNYEGEMKDKQEIEEDDSLVPTADEVAKGDEEETPSVFDI
jgi:hypothetical protein